MRLRRAALIAILLLGPRAGSGAGTISEFPHPRLVVQLHPRADAPFELTHVDRSIEAGVQGIELDLRLRPADGEVVCSHSRKHLASAPTLARAVDRILSHCGEDGTVRGNGLQFFLVSIQHPGERGRIRALHQGTDLARAGVFNVRAYDCHRRMKACVSSGVDAVNADLEEVPGAVDLAARLKPRDPD